MVGKFKHTTSLRFWALPALCLLACALLWGPPAIGQTCGSGIDFGTASAPDTDLLDDIRDRWGDVFLFWPRPASDLNHDGITDMDDLEAFFAAHLASGGTTSWAPIAYKRNFAFDPDETTTLVTLGGADADGTIIDIDVDTTGMVGALYGFPGASTETGVNGDTIWNYVYNPSGTDYTTSFLFRVMDDECLWSEWVECRITIEDDADINTTIVNSVAGLTSAISSLDAGDTILIEYGTYSPSLPSSGVAFHIDNANGTREKPITIRNFPGDSVTIENGGNVVRVWGLGHSGEASWIQLEGMQLTEAGLGCYFDKYSHNCTLRNCRVYDNSTAGVWIMGKCNTVTNCDLYDNWSVPSSQPAGLDIKILPESEDCWVEFNHSDLGSTTGICASIESALYQRGHHIRFNTASNSNYGIHAKGTHEIRFYGNKVQDCTQLGVTFSGDKGIGTPFVCEDSQAYYNMTLNNAVCPSQPGYQSPAYFNIGTSNAYNCLLYQNIACSTYSFLTTGYGGQTVSYKVSRARVPNAAYCYPLHSYAIDFVDNIGFNLSATSGGLVEVEDYDETWPPPPADAESHLGTNTGDTPWTWKNGTEDDENEYTMDVLEDILIVSTFTKDKDGDGLTDQHEMLLGTDPTMSDTDGDGYSDYTEYNAIPPTDPLDASDPTSCSTPTLTSITLDYGQDPVDTLTPNGVTGDVYYTTPIIRVGEDYTVTFNVSGGGGTVEYDLQKVPMGATFDTSTGELTWPNAWCEYRAILSTYNSFWFELTIRYQGSACSETYYWRAYADTSTSCE